MGEGDTQRYVVQDMSSELRVAGFDDAEEIGRGGSGLVYRCVQAHLGRTVAVKVLTVGLDEDHQASFLREQRVMGRLTGHPNIVKILQVGATERGHPFIVMPYYPQDSLETRIRREGPLTVDQVLKLGVKLAGALELAHRLGIIHRDVKPANILLTDYGEPELADFGIARIIGGFETVTGAVTGSPAYTAPEVLGGEPPSPSADVYGLGATLFTALTGHAAFERRSGEQVAAQFLRITTQAVPDLREQGIPDDVSGAIARAMSRKPDQRLSAVDFGDELRGIERSCDLPIDDMALHPRSAVRTNRSQTQSGNPHISGKLPLELTNFVGRRHEIAEAKNLLTSTRLVTLTGIGGVGKTRLALRVAAIMRGKYADGVHLVELSELRDVSATIDAVAAAVGLSDRSTRPLQSLIEFLAQRRQLLVLDNCEHMVGAVAELSAPLLKYCPRLQILATSREPLGVGGEAILRVPPLAVPDPEGKPSLRGLHKFDAVTLFLDRAATAVPGFVLTEHNSVAVAGICKRLDGLPLAIELAAARLQGLSAEQILQRLTARYTLLTRGSRGAPRDSRLCGCASTGALSYALPWNNWYGDECPSSREPSGSMPRRASAASTLTRTSYWTL